MRQLLLGVVDSAAVRGPSEGGPAPLTASPAHALSLSTSPLQRTSPGCARALSLSTSPLLPRGEQRTSPGAGYRAERSRHPSPPTHATPPTSTHHRVAVEAPEPARTAVETRRLANMSSAELRSAARSRAAKRVQMGEQAFLEAKRVAKAELEARRKAEAVAAAPAINPSAFGAAAASIPAPFLFLFPAPSLCPSLPLSLISPSPPLHAAAGQRRGRAALALVPRAVLGHLGQGRAPR